MLPKQEVPTTTVAQIVHRYATYDTPFWSRKNSMPGRWHTYDDEPTQYMALSTDGAWAELIRREELRSEDEIAMVSVQMWAIDVEQQMVVDFSTFELAEVAGFDPDALVDEDYGPCQREGARLRSLNYAGVLAPSAALPGALNLTLFGARTRSSWGRRPLLARSLPASEITKGAPPVGLLPRVRHFGEPHDGLVAHKAMVRRREAGAG